MTLVDDAVAVPVATRLDALIPIVAELRAADAAAERDRVLQYDALTALRGTGVLSLRVPGRYGGPGGSVRDEEVIAAANEHGIPMIFTGRRHFKH